MIKTRKSFSVTLLLALLALVGVALSGCAEEPGYGYGPGYYGSATVGYGSVFSPYGYAEPYGYSPGYVPEPVFYHHYADHDDRDFDRHGDHGQDQDHDHDDDDHGGGHHGGDHDHDHGRP